MTKSFGKTAAYTICKNEIQYVEKWLYYTKDFDYRVILDTGSTDGTWEKFLEHSKTDSGLILEQKEFIPWKFHIARRYNLDMVPKDVEWCLSPDLDEYYSINVLREMDETIRQYPDVTCIACDRLDLYSEVVRVGPPESLGTNKIHRRVDYTWNQPIYEHIAWIHRNRSEVEIYRPNLYLIHDQDFKKKSRPEMYLRMLKEAYEEDNSNAWVIWFLCCHYYKEKDMPSFIDYAIDFIKCADDKNKYDSIMNELVNIHKYADIDDHTRLRIKEAIDSKSSTILL